MSPFFTTWEIYQMYIFAKERMSCNKKQYLISGTYTSPLGVFTMSIYLRMALCLTAYQPSHFAFLSTLCGLLLKCINYDYSYPPAAQKKLCGVWRDVTGKCTLQGLWSNGPPHASNFPPCWWWEKKCQVWKNLWGTHKQSLQNTMKGKQQQYKRDRKNMTRSVTQFCL